MTGGGWGAHHAAVHGCTPRLPARPQQSSGRRRPAACRRIGGTPQHASGREEQGASRRSRQCGAADQLCSLCWREEGAAHAAWWAPYRRVIKHVGG